MDLNQRKLNKSEWNNIEVPVSKDEIEILGLIKSGFCDVNIKYNKANSLFSYLKIDYTEPMEDYLFNKYFSDPIKKNIKKYEVKYISIYVNANPIIKKADLIRIQKNNELNLDKKAVYEFILLEHIENIIKYNFKKSKNGYFIIILFIS